MRAKQTWSSSLPVPGKAAGSKVESCWGRASARQNDRDLGASLTWATAQDKQTHCCFCYSLQGGSFGRGNPPREPWWDPCPCPPLVAQQPLLCHPPAPHASPAPPALSLGLSLACLVAALQSPQHLCLAPCICKKQLKVRVVNACMSQGVGGCVTHRLSYGDAKFEREGHERKCFKWLLTSMLPIYPYHRSLIFSAQ